MQADVVETNTLGRKPVAAWWPWFVVGYVAVVLLLDALANVPPSLPNPYGKETHVMRSVVSGINAVSPWPMSSLRWNPGDVSDALSRTPLPEVLHRWMHAPLFAQFDVFKFVFWFLVPLALCGRRLDLASFSTIRWRTLDWRLFYGFCVVGFLVVCLVPFIPGVSNYYAGIGFNAPFGDKVYAFTKHLFWVVSWLVGWEFMHRYFLLQAVSRRWVVYGWLLVPFFEWAYHLQKHWIEALGMLIFAVVLTQYTLRRRNVALPFFVHLTIEIALPLTLLFSALNPLLWFMSPR